MPGTIITFDLDVFPPGEPATILLSEPLPALTQGGLTIDGAGVGVILDGSQLPGGHGIEIPPDGNVIRGLQVTGFPNDGLVISGSNNHIGGPNPGASAGCSRPCNRISGNGSIGIVIRGAGATGNTVIGNYIGTDSTETRPEGNGGEGVGLSEAASGVDALQQDGVQAVLVVLGMGAAATAALWLLFPFRLRRRDRAA